MNASSRAVRETGPVRQSTSTSERDLAWPPREEDLDLIEVVEFGTWSEADPPVAEPPPTAATVRPVVVAPPLVGKDTVAKIGVLDRGRPDARHSEWGGVTVPVEEVRFRSAVHDEPELALLLRVEPDVAPDVVPPERIVRGRRPVPPPRARGSGAGTLAVAVASVLLFAALGWGGGQLWLRYRAAAPATWGAADGVSAPQPAARASGETEQAPAVSPPASDEMPGAPAADPAPPAGSLDAASVPPASGETSEATAGTAVPAPARTTAGGDVGPRAPSGGSDTLEPLRREVQDARRLAQRRYHAAASHPSYREALRLEERAVEAQRAGQPTIAADALDRARQLYVGVRAPEPAANESAGPESPSAAAAAAARRATVPPRDSPDPDGAATARETRPSEVRTSIDEREVVEPAESPASPAASATAPPAASSAGGPVAPPSPPENAPAAARRSGNDSAGTASGATGATATTGAPAASPAGRGGAAAAIAADEQGIRAAIAQYRAAYERLDANAASAVWPTVDVRALARAFEGLKTQQLRMDRCDVAVQGSGATAACSGSATYVQRVGRTDPQTHPRHWRFQLRKDEGSWVIVQAETR